MVEKEMKGIEDLLEDIDKKIDVLAGVLNERIEKLKKVIYDYLEAGSNIALASVKANLKSV